MPLRFSTLDDPVVPCGDGSPAGIFSQKSGGSNNNSRNHIVVFEGGGFCATDEECRSLLHTRPFRFSNTVLLDEFEGSTILSDSKSVNPAMYNFNKWFVPYCSQDLYTGAGTGKIGGMIRAGSLHALAALDHIEKNISANSSGSSVDNLVVVGISAGTMAVVNHMDRIREVAATVTAANLKIILDSAFFDTARVDTNATALSSNFVDHDLHPLCNQSMFGQNPILSNVPCCISIHCHVAHGLFDPGSELQFREAFFLLDSQYDTLATLDLAMKMATERGELFGDSAAEKINAKLFGQGEFAGTRQRRVVDSTLRSNRTQTPVLWALPNCVSHPFLVPALQLDSHSFCQLQNGNPLEITTCTDTAVRFGVRTPISSGNIDASIAVSTEIWESATVGRNTIRDLLGNFVDPGAVALELHFGNTSTIILDECNGPNCLPAGATGRNFCQSLIVIESEFQGVPLGLQIPLAFFLVGFMACFFLRFQYTTKKASASLRQDQTSSWIRWIPGVFLSSCSETLTDQTVGIKLEKLTAVTKAGQSLLSDVHLELSPGSVNGLLGRSGSGKSTLLGAISGQMRRGAIVTSESDIQVNISSTTYLRQHDHVAFGNLTPKAFLMVCADIYGTEKSRLDNICSFIFPFFPNRASEEENELEGNVAEPFETNRIDSCSGGQRRALAVAAALLTGPSVLLLDEPLSGLDSVASERLMHFLRNVAAAEDLTVLVTVHQPSDDILGYLDRLVVLATGRVIFDETVEVAKRALHDEGPSISEFVHEAVKTGTIGQSFDEKLQQARVALHQSIMSRPKIGRRRVSVCASRRTKLPLGNTDQSRFNSLLELFSQASALSRRLRLQYGNNWSDLFTVPIGFILPALLLSFRPKTPVQISVAALIMLAFPVFTYTHHTLLHEKVWEAHRAELDDRRISCAAYYFASFTFSMSLPVFALLLCAVVGFAILGWDFSALLVSYLFMSFYLLLILEVGRSFYLLFDGDPVYWKYVLLILFVDNMFSGLLASPEDAPDALVWLFALSWTHWTWSGFVLNLYNTFDRLMDKECQSFVTCISKDGTVASAAFGFGVFATPLRSLCVIVGWFVFMAICENVLIRSRRANFVKVDGLKQTGVAGDKSPSITELGNENARDADDKSKSQAGGGRDFPRQSLSV